MKTFLISLIAIVVFSIIVEIFCPPKVMKKSVYMALSLAVLVVIASGIGLVFKKTSDLKSYELLNFDYIDSDVLSIGVNATKEQIYRALENEDIEVDDIEIDYSINELSIKYEKVYVAITDENKKNATKRIVCHITDLCENEVEVWVK